jgi:hypothetical protein
MIILILLENCLIIVNQDSFRFMSITVSISDLIFYTVLFDTCFIQTNTFASYLS